MKQEETRGRRILILMVLLLTLWTLTTVIFHFTEGWSWLESMYVVILTLSTVGHGTPGDLSREGMLCMSALIVIGVGLAVYLSGLLVQVVLEGEMGRYFGRVRMEREVQHMHDHFVICGYGRIGALVCRELEQGGVRFVIIEQQEECCRQARDRNYKFLKGDATDENLLKEAGIERARGLVTVMGKDAENVFVTMTARFLNRDLFIVSRASAEGIQKKLYRAGANRCISPDTIGGRHMAKAVLKPNVLEFIDLATGEGDLNVCLDEVKVPAGSTLEGQTLMDSDLRRALDLIIVAIRKSDGTMAFNPSGETRVGAGDVLLALGEKHNVNALKKRLSG